MSDDDDMDKARKGIEIIGQILKAAGDNENVKYVLEGIDNAT